MSTAAAIATIAPARLVERVVIWLRPRLPRRPRDRASDDLRPVMPPPASDPDALPGRGRWAECY